MTAQQDVRNFLNLKSIAVLGVSRNHKKFGYTAYKHLKERNYKVFPVNPNAEMIDMEKCYSDIKSIPEKPDGVLLVIPAKQSEQAVREANDLGIKSVWFQQGSGSDEAVNYCKEHGMSVVNNECIMMYAEPVESVHKFHRWIWKIFGKLPK